MCFTLIYFLVSVDLPWQLIRFGLGQNIYFATIINSVSKF